ncbi:MAG: TonB-dependent receptor plug domain-containing protein, partial [Ginsengibacter sp.]
EENAVVDKTIVNGLYSTLNFSFHLPNSVQEGNYILRAYTSWMTGFNNKQNIFSTFIHISGKANHIIAALSYKDSTFSGINIQLTDALKSLYANMPAHYELIYKNKLIEKADVTTNNEGVIYVDLNSIVEEDRGEAEIKIKAANYERLLRLPPLGNDMDVQFLPEGGSLINDIENNVAFKAIDSYGHGTDIHGYVKDSKGVVVCSFKSAHLGMGKFVFIPQSGFTYTAYIQVSGGKEFTYPLVSTDNNAYQVSVIKRSNDEIRVRVSLGDSLYKKNKASYIIGTSHGSVCFTSHGVDLYEINIPLNKFPEGIAQLTLFDSAAQPVSERLIYVQRTKPKTSVVMDKPNYKQREKVTLQLKTTDAGGKPLGGMYSVSVTDDHVVKYNEDDANIKTHLLLSPYLKGYVEEPGYYFKSDDQATQEYLDLVMLTHGWSRFTWNDIESNAKINSNQKDSSLSITGTLTIKNNTPAVGYSLALISASDDAFVGTDVTDEHGKFHFTGIDFTDSTSFVIQAKNRKGLNEDVEVAIDVTAFPLRDVDKSFTPEKLNPAVLSGINFYLRFMYDSLKDYGKVRVLKEVVINSKKKVTYDESKRVSAMSYIITPEYIEKYGNLSLLDVLYSVPGATIFDGHISFFGMNSMSAYTDPLVIVDGAEFSGGLGMNAHDVAFIEVLRGGEAAVYGVRGGNGVVLINTKTGKDANSKFSGKGIKSLHVPGYHVEKDFYSPKYETEESKEANTKDERATIYWNGNVTTDSKHAATVSFYTADMPSTYTIMIEGIAENGELVHETFPVKRTR